MQIYKTLENGMVLAEFEPSMAAAYADMQNKSRGEWGGGNIITPAQAQASIASHGRLHDFVVMDGDVMAGYCGFDYFFADPDAMYVPYLNVAPEYQNKKLGKALILQCVELTTKNKKPRLDLFTWSGNTKAVPMYKKCGFFWEDRDDATHLANFIPAVLSCEVLSDYFAEADWYEDSTRAIETEPDGITVNKFNMFEYTWNHNGKKLGVGFERSGGRMRLIDTDDYKIELNAENHELPFGMAYNCTFAVENKSGKPLSIKITGKNHKNIRFDYAHEGQIEGATELFAEFFVDAVNHPQSKWEVHPCLLADVEINGKSAEFGLGINSKYPLWAEIEHQRHAANPGAVYDSYINIKSAMTHETTITFDLPKNDIVDFGAGPHTIKIPALGKAAVKISATDKALGHVALSVVYDIKPEGKETIRFENPLHWVNRGISGTFAYEDENCHAIVNGPWRLAFGKTFANDYAKNEVEVDHVLIENYGSISFEHPYFGKPYDLEFARLDPAFVKKYQEGDKMVLEADFVSQSFQGMGATLIYGLSAAGLVTASCKIRNTADYAQNLQVKWPQSLSLSREAVFAYEGQITCNADGMQSALRGIEAAKLDENWVFESKKEMTVGVCWPAEMKLTSVAWESYVNFEIEPGELAPGAVFEAAPLIYALGMFPKWAAFRDFALNTYTCRPNPPKKNLEIIPNGGNPFVWSTAGGISLEVRNNRISDNQGTIGLKSTGGHFAPQFLTNPEKPIIFQTGGITKSADGLDIVDVALNMADFEKTHSRVLMFPKGEIVKAETGGMFTVNNGIISFAADQNYAEALHSLIYHGAAGENQWLFSKHPTPAPHGFESPFVGGMTTFPSWQFDAGVALKEARTVEFAECLDSAGNKWEGIKTTISIEKFEDLKGLTIENYFLTLPGLPVLCQFANIKNNTGLFFKKEICLAFYPQAAENLKDVYLEAKDIRDGMFQRLRMGTAGGSLSVDKMLKISGTYNEKMYAACGSELYCGGSNKTLSGRAYEKIQAAPGDSVTMRPLFLILTERDLGEDTLDDLCKITFNI